MEAEERVEVTAWHMPTSAPELSIPGLTRWIEAVRAAAFIAGARHDAISTAEATALLPHLLTAAAEARRAALSEASATVHNLAQCDADCGFPDTAARLREAAEVIAAFTPLAEGQQ